MVNLDEKLRPTTEEVHQSARLDDKDRFLDPI